MPAWFLLMLPQLIGGLGKLLASRSAINRQNVYNSPVAQIGRLKEAGLPFAAFEAGQAGSQSQLPDLTGFDTIGNAIGTGIQQGNQLEMFQELLRKASADADTAGFLRDVTREETKGLLSTVESDLTGMPQSIASANKVLEHRMRELGVWSADHKEAMDNIQRKILQSKFDSGYLQKLADEEFDRLVNTNKAMRQLWQSNEEKGAAFKRIVEAIKGSDGKLGFWEALLIQVMSGLSGGISSGGVNLGF